ncbi:MAG: 2-hydroxyhepta-2,4-diene,7-dioate isomerase, partial [Glaciihabitans sp.]|nr:2-hydroxyhepta-2,4-diene,7-dioate isomerase [Glaciihabitans sp.]
PGRIAPPYAGIGKFVCVGLNYADHAAESGLPVPAEPVLFMKATSAVIGCNDAVVLPQSSNKSDWEVELGVVIGTTARYVSEADALQHVAGYCVVNDLSEREYQIERGGQWDKGKSSETFNPLGPVFVPSAEIGDPQALGLRLWVNGEQKQDGTTANMVFGIRHIVWYLSQFMVLRPGDLINTGTPAGVALGQPEPKPYLRGGDVVELEIDGLGRARQEMVQA